MQYLICQEKKKILQILPNFFIIIIKKKHMQYRNNIICKTRSNL